MNGDKHLPEVEPVMMEEEEEEDEERTVLLRKSFRQHAQSSISSTDSDEMFSGNSEGLKFVIRDEQQHQQQQEEKEGNGYSNGSSRLEIGGGRPIYEAIPTDEIEAVPTRKPDAQNGTTIKFQLDPIPLAVANPPTKGAIEEQASYYTSLDNGTTGDRRVELRTENGNEVADLYLERIYEKPSSHNFYCPNCQACITKVIIRDREWVNNTVSAPIPTQVDKFRCTSCLSFLTPIGSWLFPSLVSPDPEEEVSSGPGGNFESIETREESQVDRAPVLAQSVDYVVTNKKEDDHAVTQAHPELKAANDERMIVQEETLSSKKGNNVENVVFREKETFQVQETGDHEESPVDRATVPDQSVDYAVADKNEGDNAVTLALPSLKITRDEGIIARETAVADQMQKIDYAVSDSTPSHPSLNTTIAEEGVVPDKGVKSKQGNKIESIIVEKPGPLLDSAETIYDRGIQDASINKTQVLDQLVNFDIWTNDKVLEAKVDSTKDSSIAKDSRKGNTVENIVVGIPYTSHESNGSVLDVDNQTATVNEVQVQNQSNGLAVLSESQTNTKVNSTPGLPSLEATMAETVTDTFDDKKGIDDENVVIGIPYTSSEPKRGLLDRFRLPLLLNKISVPDQSAAVAKTEIPKTPEPVEEATVLDSSPVSHSVGAPAAERVLDSAVGSREVEAGPVAITVDDSLDEQVEPESSKLNRWEIVKSIVYGGLAESITSLGIVASAASANTATGNIVALALANLISGLFILGHNLTGLKSEQFRRTANEADDREHVDRYEVVLGRRENYILHFVLAIFSFILFGLIPPLVYGFSFTKSNDKDFKLAAVAGASLLCIMLLALGKAYIQRPNRWEVYLKTVASYIVIAAGAGGFSYLAGDLIGKLINKYGWFEQSPAFNLSLPLPEMSLGKPAWGSS
ncbi:uncharacterized protein LOC111455896 isoform X1 [Cucurbita moschata]|uniref:Uncharacterized protein LOC111455896 isoform X1 n=1 Tax=Cucurbita moschata TaxID=3662 RepID=A0A6J1GMV7_CUCMO|nr:uncharacterized protein LOC111455896 isoform X1 [Cucurbita moschata]